MPGLRDLPCLLPGPCFASATWKCLDFQNTACSHTAHMPSLMARTSVPPQGPRPTPPLAHLDPTSWGQSFLISTVCSQDTLPPPPPPKESDSSLRGLSSRLFLFLEFCAGDHSSSLTILSPAQCLIRTHLWGKCTAPCKNEIFLTQSDRARTRHLLSPSFVPGWVQKMPKARKPGSAVCEGGRRAGREPVLEQSEGLLPVRETSWRKWHWSWALEDG